MRVPRSVMAVGGLVLAAAAIGFTNPKAVRAVTAAMVQVTNTATNPVVMQSVGQQAAQVVMLACVPVYESAAGACYRITNGVQGNSVYSVPQGESLVVTAAYVDPHLPAEKAATVHPECNAGREDAVYLNGGTANNPIQVLAWQVVNNSMATNFTYPSGVVIGPSSTLTPTGGFYNTSLDSECGVDAFLLYGYLTAS